MSESAVGLKYSPLFREKKGKASTKKFLNEGHCNVACLPFPEGFMTNNDHLRILTCALMDGWVSGGRTDGKG